METKMKPKGKGKGKAIIGIAMTAIMLASVFAAMVPTASAVAPGVTVEPTTCGTTVGVDATYTFTITNSDAFADTFMVTYPALPAEWISTPWSGYVTAAIPAGATGTFTLTLTPFVGAPPINVPVTVTSGWSGDATTKTIGCYMTPLTYNGLRNVIPAPAGAYDPSNPADPNYIPPNAVLIGQELDLSALPAAQLPATIVGDPTSDATAGQIFMTDVAGMFPAAVMTVQGTYYINPTGGTSIIPPNPVWGALAVTDPTMNLDLRASGTSVSSITQGTPLQIRFTNNLDQSDMVTLKIIDPDGDQIKSWGTQKFSKINVQLISDVYGVAGIDTTGWRIGTYTFQVRTAKTVATNQGARGLYASSNEKTLTITKATIAISAEKTEVAELETVRLTVTGVAGHVIRIESSGWADTLFPGGLNDNPATDTPGTGFTDTIDADGKRTYVVEFLDTGAYTISVTDMTTQMMEDTVDIVVTEKAVTFDIPATVYIGEKLRIKGTANTGDWVAIAFDNIIPAGYDHLTIEEYGEFSKDINTGIDSASAKLKTPGSVRLKAFINMDLTGQTFPYDASGLYDDGTTVILLMAPSLTAELSSSEVAFGDSFTVGGTAEGPREVEILTVSPKGVSGNGLRAVTGIYGPPPANTPYTGCTYDRTAVSYYYTFSKKLDVRATADAGTYFVAVLNPGSDGEYGDTQCTQLPEALNSKYGDISTKTQAQVLVILEDLTTAASGDDLIWVGYIKVATPFVTLNPIESVAVGEPLKVTGESNREEGFGIVVTVTGPKELTPATVRVTKGTFEATFDTTGAPAGTYTVKADDGDGHTDAATVEVHPSKPPAPEVSISTDKEVYYPGEIMQTEIRLRNPADVPQNVLFKWYLGIPDYNYRTKIMETNVNLPADSDQTVTIPIPVGNWGTESFCGCHIVSLTDTTTKKVVSVDSAVWIYMPGAAYESKTAAEIAKEIKKGVEGVGL